MKLFLNLIFAVGLTAANAQEKTEPASAPQTVVTKQETAPQAPAMPKWKTSFNSYFYNFEGTKAQKNNLYSFGDTTLKMQMMSLQYQLDNGWTLMGLAQYYETYVVTKLPAYNIVSKDSSRGIADTLLSANKAVVMNGSFMLITDLGVSLPTGSIDEMNPSGPKGTHYPYNMQMGSGTIDGVFGIMPLYLKANYQLGSRLSATVRTGGHNDNGYRLGNLYRLDAWADFPMKYGFTPRLVGYYKDKEGVDGYDRTSDYKGNAFLDYYHHDQINWDVSAAVKYQYSVSPKVALNAEFGVPMAQDCINSDDVIVSTRYYANLGVTGQF